VEYVVRSQKLSLVDFEDGIACVHIRRFPWIAKSENQHNHNTEKLKNVLCVQLHSSTAKFDNASKTLPVKPKSSQISHYISTFEEAFVSHQNSVRNGINAL
jgi:hypothetical protein